MPIWIGSDSLSIIDQDSQYQNKPEQGDRIDRQAEDIMVLAGLISEQSTTRGAAMMEANFERLAKMVGAPVAHANLVGEIESYRFPTGRGRIQTESRGPSAGPTRRFSAGIAFATQGPPVPPRSARRHSSPAEAQTYVHAR